MEMFHRVATQAPPELTCVLVLRNAPPAPWLPKEVHGQPVAVVVACHAGAPADGESLVAPIKSFGQPVGDVLQRRTYTSQQSLLDATQPKGRRYYWKSEYLPDLDPAVLSAALPHFARLPSPHSAIIFFQLGEALGLHPEDRKPPATATPAGCSTSRRRGSRPPTTRPMSDGHARRGRTCGGSPPEAPISTSSTPTTARTACEPHWGRTSTAWRQ